MRTLVGAHLNISDWFTAPPTRAAARLLRETTIILTSKEEALKWLDALRNPPPGFDPSTVGSLLSSLTVSTGAQLVNVEEDFALPGIADSVDELLELEEFEQLVDLRQATPFLDGEIATTAFERVFGSFLPAAEDWQLIDHYLLQQLVRDDHVLDLLLSSLSLLPNRVEIHSKSYDSQKTREETNRLSTLKSRFGDEGKSLEIFEYWSRPKPNQRKFPHPRIQKARFNRGDVYTSLDNGLRSFVGLGPIDLGRSTKETWADAWRELKAMNRRLVISI